MLHEKFDYPVAFFCNGGLGDALLSLPTLRALSSIFQEKLTLCYPANADFFCFNELNVKKIIKYEAFNHHSGQFLFDASKIANHLTPCDVFISLDCSKSDAATSLIKMINPDVSIGYFKDYKKQIKTRNKKNAFLSYFDFAKEFNNTLKCFDYSNPPKLPESSINAAKLFLSNIKNKNILLIHMETKQDKMWGVGKTKDFIEKFLENNFEFSILLVSQLPMDIEINSHRFIPVFGFKIEFISALISLSDLFLGIDSCFLHYADLCKIPGVALIHEKSVKKFGFCFSKHLHLTAVDSLSEITVDQVMQAITSLIGYVK